ncbi:C40 family peptidase [Fulvivirgaceae bacterium BMA10]|uniref:C40 family peptidase n=1 Tax=Splendidivirga corallicola TaxID=3051826 RepID=A0ABT8KRB7_9BACT|nr:C40 family peptidase [Fulvivirgaceae bacterium BMA10]
MNKDIDLAALKYSIYLISLLMLGASCTSAKKLSAREKKIKKIVATSRSFVGTPYRWGGTTRTGMDCSGLLLISFQSAGINLPRTSKDQSKIGKGVKIKELEPGDLVFFAAKKNRRKITHVGMVTEVKGKKEIMFIHASSSLGVIENNLLSNYYKGIFVKARRPFFD